MSFYYVKYRASGTNRFYGIKYLIFYKIADIVFADKPLFFNMPLEQNSKGAEGCSLLSAPGCIPTHKAFLHWP